MKEYFLLQHKMLNRKLIDFGFSLSMAYLILPPAFILLSIYLFANTEFAAYFYVFLALSLISKTSEPNRNDFLKSTFSKKDYLSIRIIENLLYSTPFMIFIAYKGLFLFFLALGILAVSMALFNFNTNTNFTIPTPFSKKPFEFTIGFRKTFFIFPFAYFLTFMAISVGNFNLGIFSMILVSLVCLTYYSKPESEYLVWIYKTSSKGFLLQKIKTCLSQFTLLVIPIAIALSIFFFENIAIVVGFLLLCYVYLASIILAKYSAYPHEMNLPQGILISVSIIFPPILIVVIPFFYFQSIKNLNPFLDDSN